MAVLSLVRNDNTDTIEALQYMLGEAQQGTLNALNATFKRPDGDEEALSTGVYKARPEVALMAIMKLSAVLMQMTPLG